MPEKLQKETLNDIDEVLAARTSFYDFLSAFYLRPLSAEQVEAMASADYQHQDFGDELMNDGFNDIWRYLRKRNTGTVDALATDYTGSFGGTLSWKGRQAVPYESVFLDVNHQLYGKQRGAVLAIYNQEGVAVESKLHLPEDHLSFMLEFLGKVSEKASALLAEGENEQAVEKLELSRDFINQHILNWFGLLKELAMKMIDTRFYRGVLKITEGYLREDLMTIEDLIAEIKGADKPEEDKEVDQARE
jgi:TorA maturation chaperone TorD